MPHFALFKGSSGSVEETEGREGGTGTKVGGVVAVLDPLFPIPPSPCLHFAAIYQSEVRCA